MQRKRNGDGFIHQITCEWVKHILCVTIDVCTYTLLTACWTLALMSFVELHVPWTASEAVVLQLLPTQTLSRVWVCTALNKWSFSSLLTVSSLWMSQCRKLLPLLFWFKFDKCVVSLDLDLLLYFTWHMLLSYECLAQGRTCYGMG